MLTSFLCLPPCFCCLLVEYRSSQSYIYLETISLLGHILTSFLGLFSCLCCLFGHQVQLVLNLLWSHGPRILNQSTGSTIILKGPADPEPPSVSWSGNPKPVNWVNNYSKRSSWSWISFSRMVLNPKPVHWFKISLTGQVGPEPPLVTWSSNPNPVNWFKIRLTNLTLIRSVLYHLVHFF